MKEFDTILDLSKDVKSKINAYNITELSRKTEAYKELFDYVSKIMSSEKHRGMIYRGNGISVVFERTLGRWRMRIWKELIEKLK